MIHINLLAWGGVDGSWLIKDFNNLVIGQGEGNFGFLIDYSFFVDQSNVTNIIGDGDLQPGVYIYPNPTSGIINFIASSKIKNIEIIDFQGKIVFKEIFNSLNAEMDLEVLQKGIYFCNVLTSKGSIYKKIIIN